MSAVWIPAGLIGISLVAAALIFRDILKLRDQTSKAWAHIDTQLNLRHEMIPHLVEAAQEYLHHEHDAIRRVLEAHHLALHARSVRERALAESEVDPALKHVLGVAAEHPELSSHEIVVALRQDIKKAEEKIYFAREYYNKIATTYNRKLLAFPACICATLIGFTALELFEA